VHQVGFCYTELMASQDEVYCEASQNVKCTF